MQIGFDLPTRGAIAAPDTITRLAVEGEAMGFDYLTLSDHIVIPKDIHARYPYSDTGEFPAGGRGIWYEQLISAAYVAAKTSRLRFVTSVMVVPHRPPVLTAKMLATIDLLSGGRLTIGVGAGWMREEFEALGAPPFAERGAVTDEYLAAFRELWTKDAPHFEGRYVRFSDVVMSPKPVQTPHPPLWIGGESPAALRRVARLGDGWYPIGTNPQHPLDTLSRMRTGIERMRRLVAEAGRDPAQIAIAYRIQRHGSQVPPLADNGERRLFSGGPADLIGDFRAFAELGVVAIDLSFVGKTVDATLTEMRRFRENVASKL
jgi:probable F420-dependent oxidoreductase